MSDRPSLDFSSPEELGRVLGQLSARLHYINRVSGESYLTWHLADLLRAAGKLTELMGDTETERLFGSGYGDGTIPREDLPDLITALLRERMRS